MERYIHRATGLEVTVGDGVELPSHSWERAGGNAPKAATKRKPAAKKAARKE